MKSFVNAVDKEGETALHLAVQNGQADATNLCLSRGAEVNAQRVISFYIVDTTPTRASSTFSTHNLSINQYYELITEIFPYYFHSTYKCYSFYSCIWKTTGMIVVNDALTSIFHIPITADWQTKYC